MLYIFFANLIFLASVRGADDNGLHRFVILPDTQIYARFYPNIFKKQVEFIRRNKERLNIVAVLHEGDIVHMNDERQWPIVAQTISQLDGVVPYIMAIGNHDMGNHDYRRKYLTRDTALFNQYFPVEKYSALDSFGGLFNPSNMDNAYHLIKTAEITWLILSLEFCPRNEVLEWANRVVADHAQYPVIILTHLYLYPKTNRSPTTWHSTKHRYSCQAYLSENFNNGQQIWDKLISQHKNILLTFNGHIDRDGIKISTGRHGNKVYQLVADYQNMGKGGDGYLKILTINPRDRSMTIQTYSPYLRKYFREPESNLKLNNINFKP
ncbi:metallophosphoesterase [Candidatus Thiomargarita nelsonii]|uniref:Metallophosphoesterase n=1 Tax=Candidatus Thiomargarita nelsonii TaxID=1003181 RepID=A0A176S413_9GAMM|nr:metallophosphoesterase [Candidatus Thiomargarita nelsonii]